MKTIKSLLVCSLFVVVVTPSCKKDKDKDAAPTANCDLLASKTNSGNYVYNYEYNAQDKVVKETQGAYTSTMEYHGDTVVETTSSTIITYILNSNGFPAIINTSANNGTSTRKTYTYDANNTIIKMISESYSQPGAQPDIKTYSFTNTFANGNLVESIVKDEQGTQVSLMRAQHDLTRPNNVPEPRSYARVNEIMAGVSKNLPTYLEYALDDFSVRGYITYEFDAKGRVTKQRSSSDYYENGQSSEYQDSTTYTYRCN